MKLRLKENSIRLRLTQPDIRQLAESGRVEESIDFGVARGGIFVYCLKTDESAKEVYSYANDGGITIFLPKAAADTWIGTEEVSVEADQQIGDGKILRLSIEKDFACLHARAGEDESGAFPNPLAAKKA